MVAFIYVFFDGKNLYLKQIKYVPHTNLMQLLLATKTPADRKEKMWSQIESEMCLQRSKTIAQMCKTKQVRKPSTLC